MARYGSVTITVLLLLFAPASAEQRPFFEPDAVLLNLTEQDLNRVLQDSILANGGPVFEGTSDGVSRTVSDLRYYADLTLPVLSLGEEGRASLSFEIREANLSIGRFERKIGWRRATCENAGVVLKPERPIDVTVALQFLIEDGSLQVVPDDVAAPTKKGDFRLVKPSRCRNALLPKWLLWSVGKLYLKRYLGDLDRALLERVDRSAGRLNDDEGLLAAHWQISRPDDATDTRDLYLFPRVVQTNDGTFFIGLSASSTGRIADETASPPRRDGLPRGSHIALSESFLNAALDLYFTGVDDVARAPSGNLARILNSRAITTLVPGLRDLPNSEVSVSLHLDSAPRIRLRQVSRGEAEADPVLRQELFSGAEQRAAIDILVSGIEIGIWRGGDGEERRLGSLVVESGRIGVIPYLNALGGLSFELVQNEWQLASSGLEFDRELFAAMLQELVFGEVFETGYHPLAVDALRVGRTEFEPRYLELVDDYLVIQFGEPVAETARGGVGPNAQANR